MLKRSAMRETTASSMPVERARLLTFGQFCAQDGDENYVVDAEHDFDQEKCQNGDEVFRLKQVH